MFRFACVPGCVPGRSWFACVLLCWAFSFGFISPVAAQDPASSSSATAAPVAALAEADIPAALARLQANPPQLLTPVSPARPRRPKSLVPLYVSFASLQAMDVHSTARALDRGAVEANPLMKGIAGNALAMSAVKVAGSVGVIYAAEKMWKKNPKAAVIFMVAANAGMALIVQHNYRTAN